MKKSTSSKKQSELLILLIDKQGDIGKAIVSQLQREKISFSGVIATKNFSPPDGDLRPATGQDLLFCPFQDSMPLFPDGDYSHILIVYNGEKEVLDTLSGFAKKSHSSNGKLFVVVPLRLYTKELEKKIQTSEWDIKIIIVGDIFGKNLFQEGTTIASFFYDAKKEERIVVPGMGLESTYPVYIDDVVLAITHEVFVKKEKKAIYLVLPPHPPTKLSLARMFQKIDPILRIDLIGEEEKSSRLLPADGVYLFDNNYSVEEKIKEIYKQETKIDEIQTDNRQVDTELAYNKKNHKTIRSLIFHLSFFIFVFFILPITSTVFFMMIGAYDVLQAKNALLQGEIKKMETYATMAEKVLNMADKTRVVFAAVPFPQKDLLLAKIDANLAQEKTVTALFLEISKLTKSFHEKNSASFEMSFQKIIALLQIMQVHGGDMPIPSFSTTSLSNIVSVLPDIAGFTKPKTYLVLLQNNMELRPGGGFIGSYAIAKINKGEAEFSLHDVYDADGQLKGHVEPPFVIRRHLKSIHWYLRDSNFSPEFQTNASASAFFLQQETGEVVDGVIAVDVSFVKMLVGAFEKIEVPDYKETVTKDNFYTVVQNHAEKDFFAGSTQKKDFLQSLFRAIQARLGQKDVPYQLLYATLLQGLAEKHVLIASREQSVQNIFTINGMSSTIIDRRNSKDSVLDFVGISEANVGVNKANVGITRSLSYDVIIDANASVSAKLTVVYKNNKTNNAYAADYKNYLRVIVPRGSMLSSISIDNDEKKLVPAVIDPKVYEAKKFVEPIGFEVSMEEENNKTLFGFLVNVPLGSETTIVVKYVLPRYLAILPPLFTYDLQLYKQPGTEAYPVSLSLQHPKKYSVIKTSKEFIKKENILQKNTQLISDLNMNMLFSAK